MRLRAILALLALCFAGEAQAQAWPTRPVTLVVPFAAGGATDAIARALAERMGRGLEQQVVVENRAGAAGAIGAAAVAKAEPDGHTILMATSSTHVILPLVRQVGYDAAKDFASIGMVATAPNLLIASPKLAANTVAELVAYGRAHPEKLSFASSGQGTVTHLIAEMFLLQAGIKAQHVPYKTGVQSFTELNEGQVDFIFDSIVWSLPQVRAGKLKGLGITSASRSSLAPDMPTIAESGLPGFEGTTWFGLVAPAKTPEIALRRLAAELASALGDKAFVDKLAALGAEPSTDKLDEAIARERDKWRDVIARAGVKVQ